MTADRRPQRLTDEDARLLALAKYGHTYRPGDALDGNFDALVGNLVELRDVASSTSGTAEL